MMKEGVSVDSEESRTLAYLCHYGMKSTGKNGEKDLRLPMHI